MSAVIIQEPNQTTIDNVRRWRKAKADAKAKKDEELKQKAIEPFIPKKLRRS